MVLENKSMGEGEHRADMMEDEVVTSSNKVQYGGIVDTDDEYFEDESKKKIYMSQDIRWGLE